MSELLKHFKESYQAFFENKNRVQDRREVVVLEDQFIYEAKEEGKSYDYE